MGGFSKGGRGGGGAIPWEGGLVGDDRMSLTLQQEKKALGVKAFLSPSQCPVGSGKKSASRVQSIPRRQYPSPPPQVMTPDMTKRPATETKRVLQESGT